MIKIHLLSALFTVIGMSTYSQCTMTEVSLTEKTELSPVVFEGAVTHKFSYWNAAHTHVMTSNVIDVYKVFKGGIKTDQVEFVTEGGLVEDELEIVTPGFDLSVGAVGVFFAQPSVINRYTDISAGKMQVEPTVDVESFIKYDLVDQIATTPFQIYTNIPDQLYKEIANQVGKNYEVIKSFDIHQTKSAYKSAVTPSITSFSPTTITSGTFSILTINGSGFGTNSGSAKVQFKYADDGGASYYTAPSSNIVSWSASQIQVMVPHESGTGTIRVTDNAGATTTSTASLIIPYGQTTYLYGGVENRIKLSNQNTAGGYTFKYNTSFNSNTAAVASFERALKTWRCATLVNFTHDGTTTTSCEGSGADGVNMISFDNSSCKLPGLGRTNTWFVGCKSNSVSYWILKEIDMKFAAVASSGGWNFGPAPSSGSKYDFETTVLHELGHAQLEAHVINPGKLMYYKGQVNQDIRSLDPAIDIACVNDNLNRSSVSNPCGGTAHSKISPSSCSVIGINENTYNNKSVTIYPNPFNNSATLHIDRSMIKQSDPISFTITDVLGNEVSLPVIITSGNTELTRNGLSNGVYFFQLKNDGEILATGKFILTDNK